MLQPTQNVPQGSARFGQVHCALRGKDAGLRTFAFADGVEEIEALRWSHRGVLKLLPQTPCPWLIAATVEPLWAGQTEEPA